jgi:hypothetical protein
MTEISISLDTLVQKLPKVIRSNEELDSNANFTKELIYS